jgi:hypothetical protein
LALSLETDQGLVATNGHDVGCQARSGQPSGGAGAPAPTSSSAGQLSGPQLGKPAPRGKSKKRRRAGLNASQDEIAAVFEHMAGGRQTLGLAECARCVDRLGLDIDEHMLRAAFELLADSGHAGPGGRVDCASFQAFVGALA